MNFIKTTDKETRDNLLKLGFKLIQQDGKTYTFLNDAKKTFEAHGTVVYTNKLNF